jgi:hypothetical protein
MSAEVVIGKPGRYADDIGRLSLGYFLAQYPVRHAENLKPHRHPFKHIRLARRFIIQRPEPIRLPLGRPVVGQVTQRIIIAISTINELHRTTTGLQI